MRNSRGFSLPEMLVYIGIASIVMLVGASILILSSRLKSQVNTYVGIAEAMNQVQAMLKDDNVFKETATNPSNATFSCLTAILTNAKGQATDCAGKGGGFTLFNVRDPSTPTVPGLWVKTVARPTVPTDGISMNGAYCSTYGQAPQIRCPFRINLSWKALCSATPCLNPVVQVSAALVSDFGAAGPPKDFHLSQNAFQFSMVRQSFAAQDIQSCSSLGGTLSGTNCIQKFYNICQTDEYLVGFTTGGQLICRKFDRDKQCQRGQTFGGFNSSGEMICNSGCDKPGGTVINPWGPDTYR